MTALVVSRGAHGGAAQGIPFYLSRDGSALCCLPPLGVADLTARGTGWLMADGVPGSRWGWC